MVEPGSEIRDASLPAPAAPAGEYWRQSRRPLASLACIAPLLLLYEGGILALGARAARNGADVWLRRLLDAVGFGQYFLLPLLVVCVLLAWHHTTRDGWRLERRVVGLMYAECVLLAIALLVLGFTQAALVQALAPANASSAVATAALSVNRGLLGRLIGFCGAGIYEESVFRLLLLPIAASIIKSCGASSRACLIGAVLLSSIAFSAAHYVGPHGESLQAFSFLFRFFAGGFFALLFVYRGFGIAAGSHALYDVFAGLLQG